MNERGRNMAIFYNQANLSYSGGSTNSNIVTGEIVEVLTATKTAVTNEYGAGDTLTYIVSVLNSGAKSAVKTSSKYTSKVLVRIYDEKIVDVVVYRTAA